MSRRFPDITFYSGPGGHKLAARRWVNRDAIADIVYLHGIVSHGGWYESSCEHLASQGFQVHFLERRGSGLNTEGRGDVDCWMGWLLDVKAYLEQLPSNHPRILLGISWGGILATAMARRYPELISGLALICPGLFSSKAANQAQRMGLRAAMASGLGATKVKIPLRDPKLFTNSAKWQRFIAQDPFALRTITIRFAFENLALLQYATEAPEDIHLPVLLMLASDDPITDNARTRRFVGRIAHPDRTIREYPGASHTLEFEDDPSAYFHDLAQWCKRIPLQADPNSSR